MKNNESKLETPVIQKESPLTATMTTAIAQVDTPANFKALKRLTRDVASLTRLGEAIIMAQSELFTIEMKSTFPPFDMRSVYALNILDCLRGEEFTLICGAVLGSTLRQAGQPLEGRYFAIKSGEVGPGKRYRKDQVVELERTK